MFYFLTNEYGIFSFDKSSYEEIIKKVRDSRLYLCYIDKSKEKAIDNKLYTRYLHTKQYFYLTTKNKEKNNTFIIGPSKPEEKDLEVAQKFNLQDDFYYEKKPMLDKDVTLKNGIYVYLHKLELVEQRIYERSCKTDNHFQRVDNFALSKSFMLNNYRRFMLIPFTAKYNNNNVIPQIILNIYDVGIITLQVIIPTEFDKIKDIPLPEDTVPKKMILQDVSLIKERTEFRSIEDYWEKDTKSKMTLSDILQYYKKLTETVSGIKLNSDVDLSQTAWVFADCDSKLTHEKFICENRKTYTQYLGNSKQSIIDRMIDKDIDIFLEKSSVMKTKEYEIFCSPYSSAICSFGNSFFTNGIKNQFSSDEIIEFKKEGILDQEINELKKEVTHNNMFDFLRFYELTFIKNYFLKKLLKEISEQKNQTVQQYLDNKRDLDFLSIKYDAELLFAYPGTQRDLYEAIFRKKWL